MKNCDVDKIYEIFGDDYKVKISPINIKDYKSIPTYIDFLSCKDKLRDYYHIPDNEKLIVFQIEINKNNNRSLVNQVEYVVFDEKKNILDLSVCSDEPITIYYGITEPSALDIPLISRFDEIGVDIFDIHDDFFNKICYSYSERNSDIILRDRVKDFYQNYSLCDSNCEYNKIDIQNMTINCNCSVKNEINIEIEEPTFNKIIYGIFENSTFGVIKCYESVFFLNKKGNIGFWMFTIFTILNIPLIIHYIIYKDISIKNYIKEKIKKYHYLEILNNPSKKKNDNNVKDFQNKNKKSRKNNKKLIKNDSSSFSTLRKLENLWYNLKENSNENCKKKNNNQSQITKFSNSYFIINNINKSNTFSNYNNNQTLNNSYLQNDINYYTYPKQMKKKIMNLKKNNSSFSTTHELDKTDENYFINSSFLSEYLFIDNYYEAIKHEKRNFIKIFFVMLLLEEQVINTLCFLSPFEIKSIHICLLIFIYACNFALNTFFYFSYKISEKYHYKGNDKYLFTLLNNISICLISTILSNIIVRLFKFLIDSKKDIIESFKEEEKKMRKYKIFFVNELKKKYIFFKFEKIFKLLRIKVIIFIISELLLLMFFSYFATAFCEIYKSTQIAWLIDCINSFVMSIIIEILYSLVMSVLYTYSLRKRNKLIYKIVTILI